MSVTLHTSAGDIKIELFCEEAPKTCENFLALCASGYYNNCVFHRNIKDFMIQTGDPTGTGKGGESIWGGAFNDEFNPELRHDSRGILSMANHGVNSNKSQFFITYAKQPHLDLKNTVFGRVIDGFDALEELETIRVDQRFRPVVEQKYYSIPTEEERLKQMQQYFNQYIDEYYEVDDVDEPATTALSDPKPRKTVDIEKAETVDELVDLLNSERVQNLVVINLDGQGPGAVDNLIIGTPLNPRHGAKIAERLSKATDTDSISKSRVKKGQGWFCINLGTVEIHLMSEDIRTRIDLEGLWGPEPESKTETSDAEQEIPSIPMIPPKVSSS